MTSEFLVSTITPILIGFICVLTPLEGQLIIELLVEPQVWTQAVTGRVSRVAYERPIYSINRASAIPVSLIFDNEPE